MRQQHVPTLARALAACLLAQQGCPRSQPVRNVAPAAADSRAPDAPAMAPAPDAPAPAPADARAAAVSPGGVPDATRGAPDVGAPAFPPARDGGVGAVADAGAGAWTGFLGGDDQPILRRVCDAAVERIERNRGGSTISFRVWFAGGSRGLFKPQQQADVANFRAELAAYRVSRLLGLHRVPPACGRTVQRDVLQRVADATGDAAFSQRVMTELLGRADAVPGAMLYWVPGPLENVPDTARWAEMLDVARPLAPGEADVAADMSRLILFDVLIDNVDRWSGGNILRQRLAGRDPSPVLFMDNGAAFSALNDGAGARPREQAARLARVGRAPRAMLAALRALTAESLDRAVREDPLGPLLGPAQIRALLSRRDRIVAHVDAMIAAHGEGAVLVFP